MLITFFIGYEVKRVVLYALVSFYFNYWMDKYNLSRKRTVCYHVNSTLNSYMMQTVQLSVPLFIFSQVLVHGASAVKLLLLIIGVMCYFRPFTKMVRATRSKDEVGKNLTYRQCKEAIFETDYRRENPALRGLEKEGFAKRKMELRRP